MVGPLLPRSVSNTLMTMNTPHRILIGSAAPDDVVEQVAVAANTVFLKGGSTFRSDLDRLVKILQRKRLRMPPAVFALLNHLGNELMWQMAFDTGGCDVVRPLLPRGILILHDVAVGACRRITAEIRQALAVAKGIEPKAEKHAKHARKNYGRFEQSKFHLLAHTWVRIEDLHDQTRSAPYDSAGNAPIDLWYDGREAV